MPDSAPPLLLAYAVAFLIFYIKVSNQASKQTNKQTNLKNHHQRRLLKKAKDWLGKEKTRVKWNAYSINGFNLLSLA